MISEKKLAQSWLHTAGININGGQPWDIIVHNEKFYSRAIHEGPLGLGESYMDGWWNCDRLDIFFDRLLRANIHQNVKIPVIFYLKQLLAKIVSFQSKLRARVVAKRHYDLGNPLFIAMLGNTMTYSCGYWRRAQSLDKAQLDKMELICKKLQLKPGMRLLDIGCGWGTLAKYASENFGVNVVGITISQQQYNYAKELCNGLPVNIRLLDYRDVCGKFDRIVSVGMFEHVGPLNYSTFMRIAHRLLTDNGLLLLHTIGNNKTTHLANQWITKYIFPNGALPSLVQIFKSSESFFTLEDLQNFGGYYDNTLMAWHENFVAHWNQLKTNFDGHFYRMWNYYLLSCAGSFRAREMQLWQFVFSKSGVPGVYLAPR